MARKRYSDEDILRLLREIEPSLSSGSDVATACRTAGVSDATYYTWRKRFGGMHCPAGDLQSKSAEWRRSEMANLKALQKVNDRLKKIVAELELDKRSFSSTAGRRMHAFAERKSLDYLKPKA